MKKQNKAKNKWAYALHTIFSSVEKSLLILPSFQNASASLGKNSLEKSQRSWNKFISTHLYKSILQIILRLNENVLLTVKEDTEKHLTCKICTSKAELEILKWSKNKETWLSVKGMLTHVTKPKNLSFPRLLGKKIASSYIKGAKIFKVV